MSIPLELPDATGGGEGKGGEMRVQEQRRPEKRRRTEQSSKESSSSVNFIDGIPDDCLLLVFSLLPTPGDRCRCAAVSKKWFRMQVLMRRSDFKASAAWSPPALENSRSFSGSDANDWRLGAMAVGNGALGSLSDLSVAEDLDNHPHLPLFGDTVRRHITDAALFVVARACGELRSLSLHNCVNVSSRGIAYVAHHCSALRKMDLGHATAVTDHGIVFLAARCLSLETLILAECPSITDTSLLAFSGGSSTTRLRSLEICHCPHVTVRGIASIVAAQARLERLEISLMKLGDGILRAVASHGRSIRLLALEKVWGLTPAGYRWLGEARGLRALRLDGCEGMTDGCIGMLSPQSFAGLRKVTLRSCSSLSGASLFSLTQIAAGLETLHLESFRALTYRGLLLALRNCSHSLKVITLVDCSFQGDGGTEQQQAAVSLSLPLQCLMLRAVKVESCVGIGDDFAAWIGEACPGVTRISFRRMDSITDQGVTAMITGLRGHNKITRLDFTDCAQIGDRSVWSATRECRSRLTHLVLAGCVRVSDRGAQVITRRCTGLVELDLSRCSITDRAVVKLIEEDPPDLEVLSLAGCTRITDRSLEVLDEYSGLGLARLNLTGCTGLTSEQADFMNIYVDLVDL